MNEIEAVQCLTFIVPIVIEGTVSITNSKVYFGLVYVGWAIFSTKM